jgi:Retrotransposon gag protein
MSYGLRDQSSESDIDIPDAPSSDYVSLAPTNISTTETNFQNEALTAGTEPTSPVMSTHRIAWPKWDGKTKSFPFFLAQLRVRVAVATDQTGQIRCFQMVQCLPLEKQYLVAHWFGEGGPDKDYNWEKFADHFALQFEDKQAKKAALEELSRMRQGATQFFTDFVSDFEYKLSVAGGHGWPDEAKLGFLENGINNCLRTALVTVTLPMIYNEWLTQVKLIAGRVESLASYRPKGSTGTKTWYLDLPSSTNLSNTGSGEPTAAPRKDSTGDTIMGGTDLNALAAAVVQAIEANHQGRRKAGKGKPRAPWRTREAFGKLVERGVCVRCEKTGHMGRNCPDFRAPSNPSTFVKEVDTSANGESDSGKE